jgi:hypothetical protein
MGPRDGERDGGISSVTVDIAMPTYNCAAWLGQAVESILAQDFTAWRLTDRRTIPAGAWPTGRRGWRSG